MLCHSGVPYVKAVVHQRSFAQSRQDKTIFFEISGGPRQAMPPTAALKRQTEIRR